MKINNNIQLFGKLVSDIKYHSQDGITSSKISFELETAVDYNRWDRHYIETTRINLLAPAEIAEKGAYFMVNGSLKYNPDDNSPIIDASHVYKMDVI